MGKTEASVKSFFFKTNNLVMHILIIVSFLRLAINHFFGQFQQTSTGSIFNFLKYRQLTS